MRESERASDRETARQSERMCVGVGGRGSVPYCVRWCACMHEAATRHFWLRLLWAHMPKI